MKPKAKQIARAVARMSILKYFPSSAATQTELMELLERMVSTVEALDWLVQTMVDRVGEWHGPRELRGVLCTRFRPADGIEANCVASGGFTPAELERRYVAELPKPVDRKLLPSGKPEIVTDDAELQARIESAAKQKRISYRIPRDHQPPEWLRRLEQ